MLIWWDRVFLEAERSHVPPLPPFAAHYNYSTQYESAQQYGGRWRDCVQNVAMLDITAKYKEMIHHKTFSVMPILHRCYLHFQDLIYNILVTLPQLSQLTIAWVWSWCTLMLDIQPTTSSLRNAIQIQPPVAPIEMLVNAPLDWESKIAQLKFYSEILYYNSKWKSSPHPDNFVI